VKAFAVVNWCGSVTIFGLVDEGVVEGAVAETEIANERCPSSDLKYEEKRFRGTKGTTRARDHCRSYIEFPHTPKKPDTPNP